MKNAVLLLFAVLVAGVCAVLLDRQFVRQKERVQVLWQNPEGRLVQTEPIPNSIPNFREAAKRILPAVVSIDTIGVQEDFFFGTERVAGSGSGVIISKDGTVVTNAHVVTAGNATQQITVHLADGRSSDARLIGIDTLADLAVLKISLPDLQPANVGRSAELEVGDWVLAVGNPFNQSNTVSAGIVGNLGRDLQVESNRWLLKTIQTDASINPGNSGGALTNAQGELVGINTAILSPRSQGSVGLGYAIPIDRVKPIVEDLIKYGKPKYGSMGLEVAYRTGLLKIDLARKQYKKETGFDPPEDGALVVTVESNGPAAKAGILPLDVIVQIGDIAVKDRNDFSRAIYLLRPGQSLQFRVFSKGNIVTKNLIAEELTNL